MNKPLWLLACWLACSAPARAQEAEEALPTDICSARFSNAAPERRVAAMRDTVKDAIATLDNAKITPSSPTLASGTISHITIDPNFAEHLDNVCVLGYFTLYRHGQSDAVPLRVEHIEVIRTPEGAGQEAAPGTRIYFRTPRIDEFDNAGDLHGGWRFWDRHQEVQLLIAAFRYSDEGQIGAPYFGTRIDINLSSKIPSVVAALLFAGLFYLTAAATVPAPHRRDQGRMANLRRGLVRRCMPWHITGGGGTASLSQLQMLMFTLIVATLLFYQWLRTGLLEQLSTDLLYLIGLSTAGAAGTQITTVVKKDLEPASYRYAQYLGWFNAPPAGTNRHASAGELLMTNKRFDIYKFQMLVFSFIIAAYVIAAGGDQLAHIQISATLLTLMGMSQGAYVGGRAASDSLTPLRDQLRGMRGLQQRHEASDDPQVKEELRRRFALAATQAAALFNTIYGRAVPEELMRMPMEAPPVDPDGDHVGRISEA